MDKLIITRKNQISPKHVSVHPKYEYIKYNPYVQDIGGQCKFAFYDIPPEKSNYPYHYHAQNVEIFYIISGTGMLETPEGDKEITAGDVIVCPPGKESAHKITNTSKDTVLSYIEVDTTHHPEVVKYPHSQKVGIIDVDESVFYNEMETMNYYDGEW